MRATDLISRDQLAIVRARADWKGVALIVHAWGIIFASMALVAWWPNIITLIAAAALIGGRQLGLAILLHDGAHGLLVRNDKWNLRLSQWFCGFPVGVDMPTYRQYHLKHHARTQQDDDPDLVLSAPFPVTRKSLLRKTLRDLTGRSGYAQRSAQIVAAFGKSGSPWSARWQMAWEKLGGIFIANAVLFAVLALAGYWWLYPTLWLLPLLTTFQLFLRLRNIAEHAVVGDKDDPFAHARTTLAGPLARAFVAPYWVNYHVEHHLLMWVPCYNLKKLHQFLRTGTHDSRLLVDKSYWEVLKQATSKAPDSEGPNKRVQTDRRRYAGLVMEQDGV